MPLERHPTITPSGDLQDLKVAEFRNTERQREMAPSLGFSHSEMEKIESACNTAATEKDLYEVGTKVLLTTIRLY